MDPPRYLKGQPGCRGNVLDLTDHLLNFSPIFYFPYCLPKIAFPQALVWKYMPYKYDQIPSTDIDLDKLSLQQTQDP